MRSLSFDLLYSKYSRARYVYKIEMKKTRENCSLELFWISVKETI
jgi:hypothetical protein